MWLGSMRSGSTKNDRQRELFRSTPGSNVLYMDGHVEFAGWPTDEFPLNPYVVHMVDAVD